jgi:hypothetical protein
MQQVFPDGGGNCNRQLIFFSLFLYRLISAPLLKISQCFLIPSEACIEHRKTEPFMRPGISGFMRRDGNAALMPACQWAATRRVVKK